MNTNTQNTRKVTEWNPELDEYMRYVSSLTYHELEHAFICDFRPSIESFSSLDDARYDYASFLLEQAEFANGLLVAHEERYSNG